MYLRIFVLLTNFCAAAAAAPRPSPRGHARASPLPPGVGGCKNLTATNALDFQSTSRSRAYPNGAPNLNLSSCQALCCATSDCTFFAFLDARPSTCWPLSSATALIPNGDPRHWIGVPPQPPPPPPAPTPAPWVPRIASGDMLYAENDASVPADLHPMIGNGVISTQIMADAVYAAGIFSGGSIADPAKEVSHRARIPAFHAVPAPGTPGPAALDVRRATYYRRSFLDPSPAGSCTRASNTSCSNAAGRVWVEQRWYAHRALPSLMVMEVQLVPANDTGAAGVRAAATESPLVMLLLDNDDGGPSQQIAFAPFPLPPSAPYAAVAGATAIPETVNTSTFNVAVLTTKLPQNNVLAFAALGDTVALLAVVRTSLDVGGGGAPAALVAAAEADYATAVAEMEAGTLWASHVAEWEGIWRAGFETDRVDFARAVNTSLYAIISSMRPDRPNSTSPGGLAQDCYWGHSFWDCETWMYPGILLTQPDIAAAMLEYRVAHIPGAEYKARTYKPPFSGAMFSWESAVSGTELAGSPWGVYEDHISSDIALAITQYWRMTRDNSGGWLNVTAWPLLRGIARFWMSKLALDNPGAGAGEPLHVKAVMGPDEYHYPVDDSAYTNAGVILSLNAAVSVAAALGGGEGATPAEVAAWADAAARVTMPWDAARGYHPEYAGYEYGTQVKQADTVLLGFPLEIAFNMTPAARANDLAAYGGKNTDSNGPAMTWGMFAIGFIELGAPFAQEAATNFNRSFANVRPPFDVWTETPGGGCPNFLTGAGGFLQTAFNGYPGLRVNLTHLTFHNPSLPEGASRVALRAFAYLGNRVTVAYDAGSISIALEAPPAAAEADAWAARPELRVAYAAQQGARAGRPLPPLSARSPAVGRVPLAGAGARAATAAPQPLAVVDAAGARWELPVVLPLQTISILAA